jgi:hypothetical protein
VNLSAITTGSPLGTLPIDPVNASSTGLYYTYVTNGTQYEVTSLFESNLDKTQYGANPIIPNYPEVNAKGSSLTINPLWNPSGLVGYWPLTEGTGTTAYDLSGNGNNGTATGTAPYYAAGKVGPYAGNFNGSNNYINVGNPTSLQFSGNLSEVMWVFKPSTSSGGFLSKTDMINGGAYLGYGFSGGGFIFGADNQSNNPASTAQGSDANQWHFLAGVLNSGVRSLYLDGIFVASSSNGTSNWPVGANLFIGSGHSNATTTGSLSNALINDVRIYNRALSAAEVMALYNAER